MRLFHFRSRGPVCPKLPCEFNRSVQHRSEFIGRGFEAQGLSRTLIESQSDRIEMGLGDAREVGSSWEVLADQAVGVFVAAALPGTARVAEVDLHFGGGRKALVGMHLLALVPRQRTSQLLRQFADVLGK